jgi:hypothetical protein
MSRSTPRWLFKSGLAAALRTPRWLAISGLATADRTGDRGATTCEMQDACREAISDDSDGDCARGFPVTTLARLGALAPSVERASSVTTLGPGSNDGPRGLLGDEGSGSRIIRGLAGRGVRFDCELAGVGGAFILFPAARDSRSWRRAEILADNDERRC